MAPLPMEDRDSDGFVAQVNVLVDDEPQSATKLATAPASREARARIDEREEAIRSIFGLRHPAALPRVDEDSLLTYYLHLTEALSFPLAALIDRDPGLHESRHHTVTVFSLINPARVHIAKSAGLRCVARKGKMVLEVPLARLWVPEDDPSHRLIRHYRYWLRRCR
jgi:hypothetical protein